MKQNRVHCIFGPLLIMTFLSCQRVGGIPVDIVSFLTDERGVGSGIVCPTNHTDAFEKCENMTERGFTGTFGLISNPE